MPEDILQTNSVLNPQTTIKLDYIPKAAGRGLTTPANPADNLVANTLNTTPDELVAEQPTLPAIDVKPSGGTPLPQVTVPDMVTPELPKQQQEPFIPKTTNVGALNFGNFSTYGTQTPTYRGASITPQIEVDKKIISGLASIFAPVEPPKPFTTNLGGSASTTFSTGGSLTPVYRSNTNALQQMMRSYEYQKMGERQVLQFAGGWVLDKLSRAFNGITGFYTDIARVVTAVNPVTQIVSLRQGTGFVNPLTFFRDTQNRFVQKQTSNPILSGVLPNTAAGLLGQGTGFVPDVEDLDDPDKYNVLGQTLLSPEYLEQEFLKDNRRIGLTTRIVISTALDVALDPIGTAIDFFSGSTRGLNRATRNARAALGEAAEATLNIPPPKLSSTIPQPKPKPPTGFNRLYTDFVYNNAPKPPVTLPGDIPNAPRLPPSSRPQVLRWYDINPPYQPRLPGSPDLRPLPGTTPPIGYLPPSSRPIINLQPLGLQQIPQLPGGSKPLALPGDIPNAPRLMPSDRPIAFPWLDLFPPQPRLPGTPPRPALPPSSIAGYLPPSLTQSLPTSFTSGRRIFNPRRLLPPRVTRNAPTTNRILIPPNTGATNPITIAPTVDDWYGGIEDIVRRREQFISDLADWYNNLETSQVRNYQRWFNEMTAWYDNVERNFLNRQSAEIQSWYNQLEADYDDFTKKLTTWYNELEADQQRIFDMNAEADAQFLDNFRQRYNEIEQQQINAELEDWYKAAEDSAILEAWYNELEAAQPTVLDQLTRIYDNFEISQQRAFEQWFEEGQKSVDFINDFTKWFEETNEQYMGFMDELSEWYNSIEAAQEQSIVMQWFNNIEQSAYVQRLNEIQYANDLDAWYTNLERNYLYEQSRIRFNIEDWYNLPDTSRNTLKNIEQAILNDAASKLRLQRERDVLFDLIRRSKQEFDRLQLETLNKWYDDALNNAITPEEFYQKLDDWWTSVSPSPQAQAISSFRQVQDLVNSGESIFDAFTQVNKTSIDAADTILIKADGDWSIPTAYDFTASPANAVIRRRQITENLTNARRVFNEVRYVPPVLDMVLDARRGAYYFDMPLSDELITRTIALTDQEDLLRQVDEINKTFDTLKTPTPGNSSDFTLMRYLGETTVDDLTNMIDTGFIAPKPIPPAPVVDTLESELLGILNKPRSELTFVDINTINAARRLFNPAPLSTAEIIDLATNTYNIPVIKDIVDYTVLKQLDELSLEDLSRVLSEFGENNTALQYFDVDDLFYEIAENTVLDPNFTREVRLLDQGIDDIELLELTGRGQTYINDLLDSVNRYVSNGGSQVKATYVYNDLRQRIIDLDKIIPETKALPFDRTIANISTDADLVDDVTSVAAQLDDIAEELVEEFIQNQNDVLNNYVNEFSNSYKDVDTISTEIDNNVIKSREELADDVSKVEPNNDLDNVQTCATRKLSKFPGLNNITWNQLQARAAGFPGVKIPKGANKLDIISMLENVDVTKLSWNELQRFYKLTGLKLPKGTPRNKANILKSIEDARRGE